MFGAEGNAQSTRSLVPNVLKLTPAGHEVLDSESMRKLVSSMVVLALNTLVPEKKLLQYVQHGA
jgi:hypothetical protein